MGWGKNRRSVLTLVSALLAVSASLDAAAQEAPLPEAKVPEAEEPKPDFLQVPPLTPIELIVDAELGSKISSTGQMFPLHLAKAIVVDGKELVPAGTIGEGEIVHAKKAGGSGAPGELVVAARYLQVGDKRLKLRSMRIGLVGKDAVNGVVAFNAVTAATPLPIGIIGFAVTGRNVVYPAGTIAAAKTAEAFPLKPDAPDGMPQVDAKGAIPLNYSSDKIVGQR